MCRCASPSGTADRRGGAQSTLDSPPNRCHSKGAAHLLNELVKIINRFDEERLILGPTETAALIGVGETRIGHGEGGELHSVAVSSGGHVFQCGGHYQLTPHGWAAI